MILKEIVLKSGELSELVRNVKNTLVDELKIGQIAPTVNVEELALKIVNNIASKTLREFHESDPVRVHLHGRFVDATFVKYTDDGKCVIRVNGLNNIVPQIFIDFKDE